VASDVHGASASTGRAVHASRLLLVWFVTLACAEKKASPPPVHDPPVVQTPAEAPSPPRPAFENAYAQIPPQCYVKTRRGGRVNNSCAACHRESVEPNFVDDAELQLSYALPPSAHRNPYTNLLAPVDPAAADVDDADVLAYVRRGNYRLPGETLPVAARPVATREGYVPDAHFRFDERGFDRDPSGVATGWRAFAYEPLPGGFGPELGSFGDVLIRLPPEFRQDRGGAYDEETYIVNLALVEALIVRADVAIEPVDERRHGADLDGDGALGVARRVHFRFDRSAADNLCFVGRASASCATSKPAPALYPLGTEFLHSLRYLDITREGVVPASRMKELRYAKKTRYLSYAELRNEATHEAKERAEAPDRPRRLLGDETRGVANGQGWIYRAFIEDARGELRAQSAEEHLSCVGCHGGVGVTTDSSFALPRKIRGESAGSGWVHQLAPERKALPGAPRLPSKARALALDELYWSIVKAQSFAKGRGPVTTTPDELWADVPAGELTGVAVAE
jgi:hypothetical protein